MAPPRRPAPAESPVREYSSRQRQHLQDEEAGYFEGGLAFSSRHARDPSKSSYADTFASPVTPTLSADPVEQPLRGGIPAPELSRKRSLIRPERNRIDQNHPNYHYRQHAAHMNILPSSTGNDPILEELEAEAAATETSGLRSSGDVESDISPPRKKNRRVRGVGSKEGAAAEMAGGSRVQKKLRRERTRKMTKEEKEYRKQLDDVKPPSFWNVYCAIVTFWCPAFMMKCCGMPAKEQQRAWREKVGLISIILVFMGFVGYLTFGFTATVCDNPGLRLRVNHVDAGYMIFHGKAYDLAGSHHPVARGIPAGSNVLYDLPEKHGGQDGSFLFQKVNGKCKDLITLSSNSDVPTNTANDLAWYFPCTTFNQDGSSPVNQSNPYYLGYACHTSADGRNAFYDLKSAGDVFFNWNDIKNVSRNLMVYSGNVLDLNLLNWFNSSQVSVPAEFAQLADRSHSLNAAVHGRDITHSFQTKDQKKLAQCLEQIIKVGTVDTETVGCIASKVVLWVSLAFILSIVGAKFGLALFFQWFMARKFAAAKTSQSSDKKKRAQQIEDWSDDIYRPPPRFAGDVGSTVMGSDRTNRRGSTFLPTTSRFTSPYAGESNRLSRVGRPQPVTMVSQASTAPLFAPNPGFGQQNSSRHSLLRSDNGFGGSGSDQEGPAGFIHESVVPQPPSEWQPFGYPLAHAICLVTTYSEGELGIRTTLDSIATTDYPNSHKVILVICDGLIQGEGETITTPEVVLGMMKDHSVLPEEVPAFSYVAVSSGSKRHNMAKVYSGFYDYGANSGVPLDRQQRVPMMCVVKCGTPDEAKRSKPGNRGKRDSQIILMSFLQKVMFDERMTELEFEMFNGLWKVTGISPDFYETVLMVDADTKVFPDSLTHMISAMVKDPQIMGLCGETKIANKRASWVSAIQVFEYFISHHMSKSFESVFGGVTCLPGCFCMYRVKAPKGGQNYWVPILANPDVVEHYSENVVDTLHKKNLLLLGEDRYLSTLMLRTFPKRKQVFVPQAVCKTTVPEEFSVLLSQRRRWINSTVHNLMELVLVRDLCGTFCFSMQFVVAIELIGTVVLPAAITFTVYVVVDSIIGPVQTIPLILLALILGLPAVLIVLTAHRWSYVLWMLCYLLSLPIWNFVLPVYAFWKFDDFSWGDTRKTAGETTKKAGIEYEGEFDSSKITMKRWGEFERDRRIRVDAGWSRTGIGSREGTHLSVQAYPGQYHLGSDEYSDL
ncbi:class IV chitin synthase [Drepanopeziza brunnea f. sp. 'multigermtubi' MB_m1]|uniref:chitin synthase n=1 Tax=Marssonina brunnea f. sp. multigermtubi (strain MB_m1) TaxID=1072389 RepID=K1WDR6_MARBU|nr:class IV chitin synthase [Drepanopeziza brunnea f. sp. 'multigermtubi' MB_m1]EKD15555.1 class IV chitin synthase [Drepanopeziza brunnea f. sp. 'multigermtubi' MB_m1]